MVAVEKHTADELSAAPKKNPATYSTTRFVPHSMMTMSATAHAKLMVEYAQRGPTLSTMTPAASLPQHPANARNVMNVPATPRS